LQAFYTANGAPVTGQNWPLTLPGGATFATSPAIAADGTLYFGASDGLLYAVNSNGSQKWRFDTLTHQAIASSVALASDGSIYFGAGGRLWSVADAGSEGYMLWSFPDVLNQPALAAIKSSPLINNDGTIYFGCGDGTNYAVYGNAGPATGIWPMFRRDQQHSSSAVPSNFAPPAWWISVALTGPPDIYKGLTGFGYPDGGETSFTFYRNGCGDLSSPLQVSFFLGGDGTSSTCYSGSMVPCYQVDFNVSTDPGNGSVYAAPAPNAFTVTFPQGSATATINVQTIDNSNGEWQPLPLNLTGGRGYTVLPNQSQAYAFIHPDSNQ
jgi:hypothetical protein